ncbi:hypothetical protein L7F22_046402, partial [Adiantum nelumboides]|nr:hypothetical protein [Adiantum nelumboides]
MAFPNFHGKKGENARNFLDDLEMAFLISRRDSAEIKLRAFPLVLREEAKVWFQGLDEGRQGDWEVLKRAFLQRFHYDNNPEEIWRKLSQLQQASPDAYPAYEARFLKLWTQWEQILLEGERAPNFLQKERFLAGLASVLREKVKCKFPDLFEDALTWARLKDCKLQFQRSMLDQSQAAAAGTTSQEQAPPPPPNESGDPHLDLLQRVTNQLDNLSINLIHGFLMAKKDSPSEKRHEVIDGVTSDFVYQWYVNVYDLEGNRAENLLLFTLKNESSIFEKVGVIEDIMDGCAGKEGVPCNVVKIKGKNASYKHYPLSFDFSH